MQRCFFISLLLIVSWLPQLARAAACENLLEQGGFSSVEEKMAEFTKRLLAVRQSKAAHTTTFPDLVKPLVEDVYKHVQSLPRDQQQRLKAMVGEVIVHSGADLLKSDVVGFVSVPDLRLHMYDVVLEHPLGAVIARHELTHLLRFNARPFLTNFRAFFAQHAFSRTEEIEAFQSEYDFVRAHISQQQLDTFKKETFYLGFSRLIEWGLERGLVKGTYDGANYQLNTAKFYRFLESASDTNKQILNHLLAVIKLPRNFVAEQENRQGGGDLIRAVAKAKMDRFFVVETEKVYSMDRDQYVSQALKFYGVRNPYINMLGDAWLYVATMVTGAGVVAAHLLGSVFW